MSKWRVVLATVVAALCLVPVGLLYGCGPKDDTVELRPDEAKGLLKPRTEGAQSQTGTPSTD